MLGIGEYEDGGVILKFIPLLQNHFVITNGWYVHHNIDH